MRIALLALALTFQDQAVTTYANERYGFELALPSAEWTSLVAPGASNVRFQVTLYPRGSGGVPSLTVLVDVSKPDAAPEKLREHAVELLESRGARGLERSTSVVGASETLAVRGELTAAPGLDVVLECAYVVDADFTFALQSGWKVGDERAERELDAMLKSFTRREPHLSSADAEAERLRALAARCWEVGGWCETWEAAAQRARDEGKLVLAVFENGEALAIPRVQHTASFLDPDFRALIEERFVPLRMGPRTSAPFRDPSRFGVGAQAWGRDFFFVDPAGTVLRETSVSNAAVLYDIASSVARAFPAPSLEPPANADPMQIAERELRRGELERAHERLAASSDPRRHRLLARWCRLKRDGADALDESRLAREEDRLASACDIDTDEALILARMNRGDEARARFERIASDESCPRAAEALFYLGAFETLANDAARPSERWRELVERFPDDPWAWKAAANLSGAAAFVHGGELLEWPAPDATHAVDDLACSPADAGEVEGVLRDAMAYLTESQRDSGAWVVPMEAFGYSDVLYTQAVSAICATALIPAAKESRARRAVERTLAATLAAHENGALGAGDGVVGTYAIWRQSFALWLITRCAVAGIGDVPRLRRAMGELVTQILARRHSSGGWPYVYFPGDPHGERTNPSASFITAGVVLVLLEARDAGAHVDDADLTKSLDFLASLHTPDGTFRYMPGAAGVVVDGSRPEAGGRGPICALALLRGERADVATLRETLELFVRHRGTFLSERGKELCHTGPQAQGAHYLLYDYFFASAALRHLPRGERARLRTLLLDDLLGARLADGSFEDLPSLGRAYGTAMTSLALRELLRDER